MKVINKLLCAILGICMVCACFVGCNSTTAGADELSYVSMRINPEIELVVNKDGKVVAVNAINEDGETVLCELSLVNLTVEEATEQFTAMATELGFIDVNSQETNVYILVDGKNKDFVKEIEEKVTKKVNGFFDKKGIFGKVAPEILEEYQTLAEEWGVDLKDAKLISRILELYPEMTVEEILELSVKERIELIKDDHLKNGLPVQLRDEYKQAVELLKEEYSELFELGAKLEELEKQLENETLGEEELALIQQECEELKAQFDMLKEEFKNKLELLKVEKREKIDEIKQGIKDKAQDLRDEFAGKLQEHENNIKDAKEQIEEQIKNWRDKR